jgi:hypothetical protein
VTEAVTVIDGVKVVASEPFQSKEKGEEDSM